MNDDAFYAKQQSNAIQAIIAHAGKTVGNQLIICNTFAKPVVTPAMATIFYRLMLKLSMAGQFSEIFFVIGKSEVRSKHDIWSNAFSVIAGMHAENQFDIYDMKALLVDTEVDLNKIVMVPYGVNAKERNDPHISINCNAANALTMHHCMNLDNNDSFFFTLNLDIYASEMHEIDQPSVTVHIEVDAGNIDDKPAIAWISENRKMLKEARQLRLLVDDTTDNVIVEKLQTMLSSINSNYEVDDKREKPDIDIDASPASEDAIREAFVGVLPLEVRELANDIYNSATGAN